jgi:hypothetical protein
MQVVNFRFFKTEKDTGRRVKVDDCGSKTCPNSVVYDPNTKESCEDSIPTLGLAMRVDYSYGEFCYFAV